MRDWVIFAACLALASSTLLASLRPARAQASVDEQARLHFQVGKNYFDTGEYELALREFQRAYDLSKRPALFYNISLTHERMGNLPEAVRQLERYLEEGGENVPNRETLEIRLRNLKRREQKEKQRATGKVQSGPKAKTRSESKEEAGTQEAQVAKPTPQTQHAPPPATEAPSRGGLPTAALASYIAGGVGLAVFGTFGTLVAVRDSNYGDGCLPAGTCTQSELNTQDTFALIADIGLGVAIVGAALGTTLLLTQDEGAEQPPSVAISPWLGSSGGGTTTTVRF